MKPTTRQYAELLRELSNGEGDDASIAESFIGYLRKRGEVALLPGIIAEYEEMERRSKNAMRLEVTTAHPVSEDDQKGLTAAGAKLFKGEIDTVSFAVSPSQIGGVVLRTEERRFDGSVVASLRAIRQELVR